MMLTRFQAVTCRAVQLQPLPYHDPRWAAAEGLVAVETHRKLSLLQIRHGRPSKVVPPVDDALVNKTTKVLSPVLKNDG